MSWSLTLIGTPEGVHKELDSFGEQMSEGQSKDEFLEAKPALQALVTQIVGQSVRLTASGHATFTNGQKTFGNVMVSLEPFYGKFCQ